MILQLIGAFVACMCFGILFEIEKRHILYAGAIGTAGWCAYLFMEPVNGTIAAVFIASTAVSLIAHILARTLKTPVTIFLIPGIITMVPGAGMYHTVYQLLLGTRSSAVEYLQNTLQIAGMIAVAVFLVDSIFRIFPIKHKS